MTGYDKTTFFLSFATTEQKSNQHLATPFKDHITYLNAAVLVETVDAEGVLVLAIYQEDLLGRDVRQADRAPIRTDEAHEPFLPNTISAKNVLQNSKQINGQL